MSATSAALAIALANIGLWSLLNFWVYYNLFLIWLAWRGRRDPVHPALKELSEWPAVTVQLPLYNEAEVCETLIDAVAALDYPRDRLRIQVLDDSTDDTVQRVAGKVAEYRAQGLHIEQIRRTERTGFKAGALAEGLKQTSDDFILILDADFVPQASLLRELMPYFTDDRIAMVQARWGHARAPSSALERTAAFWIDRHFVIEQFARHRWGHFFHFNGTGGIWRRSAIEDAGGWSADTLAEDLDLSLRAWSKGWRFVYADDVVVPALLPPDVRALRIQQARWAKGAFQVARKHLPTLWRSRRVTRRDATLLSLHLTGYSFPILLLSLALLAGPVAWARTELHWFLRLWLVDLPAVGFVVGLLVQAAFATIRRGRSAGWVEIEASSLGLGLAPLVARNGLKGIRQFGGTFQRTPKLTGGSGWRFDGDGAVELLLAVACTAGAGMAAFYGGWTVLPLPLLAGIGLLVFGWGAVRGTPRA